MDTVFFFKNMMPHDESVLREYVSKKLGKIEKVTAIYPADAVLLEVKTEYFDKHNAYDVQLILRMPSITFKSNEASHLITKAVDLAKDRLLYQLLKHVNVKTRLHRTIKAKTKEAARKHKAVIHEAVML